MQIKAELQRSRGDDGAVLGDKADAGATPLLAARNSFKQRPPANSVSKSMLETIRSISN
jgi:hypothetical protein